MARGSPRRGADPLARAWGRQFIGVDELGFYKAVNLSTTRDDHDDTTMGKLLSPIDEEGHGMSCKTNHDNASLSVHLTLRFNDPAVKSVHSNSYYSSRFFRASERICRGLVRRIDHGSEELLTRKDPHALNNIQCLRKGPKPWRFEITFKIHVKGHSGPWAQRVYISYQKQPLDRTSADQVLRSAHSIVGLFLQRHDKGFYWKDSPSGSYFPDSPDMFRPGPDVVPNLACVPRTLFVEPSQDWEFVPGYTLRLVIKSNSPARAQSTITRTVRIDSTQISPLNLGFGEDLLWQAYGCVQDVLDLKKNNTSVVDRKKNALSLELNVVNNLGPAYDHLQRSIHSDLCLSGHPKGQDVNEFADTVRNRFKVLRSQMDRQVETLHDFDFRIAELVGDGWRVTDCARFVANGNDTLTRRDVEALLERIRAGVGDVLRGYDVAVRMVAYKRGHLVLDKALVARDRHQGPSDPPLVLINRLKERIQKDIDMICKDTCSLDDIPEVPPLFAPSRPRTASPGRCPQTPPGSLASFRTRPPTPPNVPARRVSSARSFPLVPIKYKESADGASVSSRSPRPPVVGDEGFSGLKPAAELYPSTRTVDFDVESSSTHSSMPTLADSDTPSPEHSMLITPSGARSGLPINARLSFEDSGFRRFSTDEVSASSRTSYSEGQQCVAPKDEKPEFRVAPSVPAPTEMQDREDSSGSNHVSGTKFTRPGSELESSGHGLPTEGWLLHRSENSETPKDATPRDGGAIEMLPVAKVEEEASTKDSGVVLVSPSGPAEISEGVGRPTSDTRHLAGDEEPDEEAVTLGTVELGKPTGHSVGSEPGQCPVGMSEKSEHEDHVTCLEAIDETPLSAADGPGGEFTSDQHVPDEKPASDPSIGHEDVSSSPSTVVEATEAEQEGKIDSESSESSPAETDNTTSAPTQSRHIKHLSSGPNVPNRNSWSSSSEWEDWMSISRQSRDSVDTIRASLHSSIQEDEDNRPDSPKHLRTPTAGLLGLSESRWADFGIRSALTGTHAFDACRPSTAPLLAVQGPGPEKTCRDKEGTATKPARPPHKRAGGHYHLRQKKSIGSILFLGGDRKKAKANKKQTVAVEPRPAKESVDDAGRFPQAMMLVAGLAFASSVVSRNGN